MLSDNKVIDFFYMADDFCIFLMKQLKNIQSKMAKSIDIILITYKQAHLEQRLR